MLLGGHLVCPSPPCPIPFLSILASKVTLGLEADGGIFTESIYFLRFLLPPSRFDYRRFFGELGQYLIGLYIIIGEPGWASDAFGGKTYTPGTVRHAPLLIGATMVAVE